MFVLLIAAIGALAAGALAILYGFSYKEFSFGNTMMLSGVIGMCSGLVLFGLWVTAREMRAVARRIAMPASAGLHEPSLPELGAASVQTPHPARSVLREPVVVSPPPRVDEPVVPEIAPPEPEVRPVSSDVVSAAADEPAPEVKPKPRRNLLFESTVRKERDRSVPGKTEATATPAETAQRTVFEDPIAQRGIDRADRQLRTRSPSTYPDPKPAAAPDVTVLKSGVVDGMAYSLYSDGSIEAQMPEGMMRFGSIEELRAHLDQRT